MGGTVAVFHRDPDGNERMMHRHTSMLGYAPKSLRFYQKDPEWVRLFNEPWDKMREDMEKNGPDGPFDYHMTDCYLPEDLYTPVAPYGYGLVVLDQVNDVILTSQGYTSFDYISGAGVSIDIQGRVIGDTEETRVYTRFKELYDAGRITSASISTMGGKKNISLHPYTFDEIIEKISVAFDPDDPSQWEFVLFNVDIYPFKIEEFKESNLEDQRGFMERLGDLDIQLNDCDILAWEEHFDRIREY